VVFHLGGALLHLNQRKAQFLHNNVNTSEDQRPQARVRSSNLGASVRELKMSSLFSLVKGPGQTFLTLVGLG